MPPCPWYGLDRDAPVGWGSPAWHQGLPIPAPAPQILGPLPSLLGWGSKGDPCQPWGASTLLGPAGLAQNSLQKERASGDETAGPHPLGFGTNGGSMGLSHW